MCEVGTGRIHLCIAIISGVGESACVCSSGIESVRCQPFTDAEKTVGESLISSRPYSAGSRSVKAGPVADAETVLGESMMCCGLAGEADPRAVGERPVSVPSGQPFAASSTETAPSTETASSTQAASSKLHFLASLCEPGADGGGGGEKVCTGRDGTHGPATSSTRLGVHAAVRESSEGIKQKRVPKQKAHPCPKCLAVLSRPSVVKLRTRKHRGGKPCGCEECGKTLASNRYLAAHARIKGEAFHLQ